MPITLRLRYCIAFIQHRLLASEDFPPDRIVSLQCRYDPSSKFTHGRKCTSPFLALRFFVCILSFLIRRRVHTIRPNANPNPHNPSHAN